MLRTIIKKAALIAALGVTIGINSSAHAALTIGFPMDYNTANVVGTVQQFAGDNPGNDADFFAQRLLNVVGANTIYSYASGDPVNNSRVYHTAAVDYSGTIQGEGVHTSPATVQTINNVQYVHIPAGWEYVIAKYDGQNAGWVMFALGGQESYIPALSQSFWGTAGTDQFLISGYTTFNPVPEPSTVIAGALLLLPFAASTMRFMRKKKA